MSELADDDPWNPKNVTEEQYRRLKYYAALGEKKAVVGNLIALADIVRFVADRTLNEQDRTEYEAKIDKARVGAEDPMAFVLWCLKLKR